MQTVATDARILDQAIDWHLRQPTMSADDWAAFVAWLEADPAHADAYDRVAASERLVPASPAMPLAANDDAPRAPRWRWAVAGTIAAAFGALWLVPIATLRGAAPYMLETATGERRTVALNDGTRIEMSGGTRLTLDRNDDRTAVLDRGQAIFTVRHDADRPFTLTAGGTIVRDLGTVFDVTRLGERFAVQVAEGSVMVQPEGERIVLTRGQTLTREKDGADATRGTIAPVDVGGWRSGRIAFTDATLGDVVATWRRLYGTHVTLAGALPDRPFTGMVELTGKAESDVPHMAALIGVGWRRTHDDWIIGGPTPTQP